MTAYIQLHKAKARASNKKNKIFFQTSPNDLTHSRRVLTKMTCAKGRRDYHIKITVARREKNKVQSTDENLMTNTWFYFSFCDWVLV